MWQELVRKIQIHIGYSQKYKTIPKGIIVWNTCHNSEWLYRSRIFVWNFCVVIPDEIFCDILRYTLYFHSLKFSL